jgi:tetratricopeptide (TPR) repeat protein
MKFYYTILSLFITGLLLSGCQPESAQQASSQEESHLGSAHLEVTGSEAALPHFKEGLLLLHSFEYDDARAAFQEALEVDPEFRHGLLGRSDDP